MPKSKKGGTTSLWAGGVYIVALRRAEAAIRRGLKVDAAYWMKVADHAHRIMFRGTDATLKDELAKSLIEEREQRIAHRKAWPNR